MMQPWRILCLLALAAFWAQSSANIPPALAAAGQSAAVSQNSPAAPQTSSPTPPSSTSQSQASQGPAQPIPFSHKQHAGTLNLPCQFCHTMSPSGQTLRIPQAAFCMQCHQTIATNNPGVEKLAAYAKSSSTIPWVRIYQLPSFVSFSHKTHLAHGITCQQCHGPVAQRVRLANEMDTSMAACIQCHRVHQASTDCDTCHMLEQ